MKNLDLKMLDIHQMLDVRQLNSNELKEKSGGMIDLIIVLVIAGSIGGLFGAAGGISAWNVFRK